MKTQAYVNLQVNNRYCGGVGYTMLCVDGFEKRGFGGI